MIKKDMLISEIMQECPEAIEVMIRHGLHCVGCGAGAFESLEDGCMAHGMDSKEIDEMVKEMNALAGHKESENLKVSKEAAAQLNEELNGENGLKIMEKDGEIVTYFTDKPAEDDVKLESGKIKIFIEKDVVRKLKGKKLNFKYGEFVIE